jgi:hypothetical protein
MQALKALVVVMGILLVVGLILIAFGFVSQLSERPVVSDGFGEKALTLPAGCVIAAAEAAGERLVVRVDGPAERGCQQVVVLDLASGEILGRLRAAPGP